MNAFVPRFQIRGSIVIVALALTTSAAAAVPAGRYTSAGGSVYDNKTKLTWQQTAPSTTYVWADAMTYCANVAASLGGTGWRLPTMKELQTIVDDSRSNPAIDLTAFPGTPSTYFWSSSPDAGSPSTSAWYVYFTYGQAFGTAMSSAFNVRCVR